MARHLVDQFLYHGGLINTGNDPLIWPFSAEVMTELAARRERAADSAEADVREGIRLWRNACQRVAERAGQRGLFVPLSAGLDSRAVLAGLSALGVSAHTATYGIPGALDYELTPRIAGVAGASHERINLADHEFEIEDLMVNADEATRVSALIDMHINHLLAVRCGSGRLLVSGFGGDAVTGKHVPETPSRTWQESRERFVTSAGAGRSVALAGPGYDPASELPALPFVDPSLVAVDEQLDFAIRQQRLIAPIVCPPSCDVATPFFDTHWLAFMLSRGFDARRRQRLFVRIVSDAFPALFALPTTARRGLTLSADTDQVARHVRRLSRRRRWRARLRRVWPATVVPPRNRNWQYIEFETALRADTSYARVVRRTLDWLQEDALVPHLDLDRIWRDHREGRANHEKALAALCSLGCFHRARPTRF